MDRLTAGCPTPDRPAVLLCIVILSSLHPLDGAAQRSADSPATLNDARSAQAEFERTRRRYLPWSRTSRGRESITIGRFRFWYDEDDSREPPQPEHPRIVAARHRLLAHLDSAAAILPGDPWIAGQRVRYLSEVGRFESALAAARACQASAWWCRALTGFVQHEIGNFAAAEEAFDGALAAMPDTLRCEWNDLTDILDGAGRRAYRNLSCASRAAFEARLWWLADPLYLVQGNERRTEHFARRVYDALLRGSASTFGIRWGRDNREIVIRFGWPVRWERERGPMTPSAGGDAVIGHQRDRALRFLPPYDYLRSPSDVARGDWPLDPYRPPARYAPTYVSRFEPLEHQLSAFRRGDSVTIVAAYRPPQISDRGGKTTPYLGEAALVLSAEPGAARWRARARGGRPITLTVPRQAFLVGLETLSRSDSVAGRARYWVDLTTRVPDGFAVSDLLLMHRTEQPPQSLAEAATVARPAFSATRAEEVGLYWEVYDSDDPSGELDISLTVEKIDKGFFRRAGEILGVVGKRRDRVALRWRDRAARQGVLASRAISVRLPESEGRYAVTITANRADGVAARAVRGLTIRDSTDSGH